MGVDSQSLLLPSLCAHISLRLASRSDVFRGNEATPLSVGVQYLSWQRGGTLNAPQRTQLNGGTRPISAVPKMVAKVILVTGGSGLVGQAVKEFVDMSQKNEKWIFLSRQDADLCDTEAVRAVFDLYKPTHVVHLAAYVGGLFANMVWLDHSIPIGADNFPFAEVTAGFLAQEFTVVRFSTPEVGSV